MRSSRDHEQLEEALRGLFPGGASLRRPDASTRSRDFLADVSLGGAQLHLELKSLRHPSRAMLADAAQQLAEQPAAPRVIRILAADYLSAANQEALRQRGVPFMDFAGNAWIVAPGLHIDRRGFANPVREKRDERDVFSDKASIVLRIMLDRLQPLGVRQIAELSGAERDESRLSPGYVSKVLAELERRGYASKADEKVRLRHPDELLHEWVIAYRARRKPPARSYYLPERSLDELMNQVSVSFDGGHADYVFAGLAGASVVDRHAEFDVVDMYVRDESRANDILVSMGGRRVERGGNVSVSLPYYRISAFFGHQLTKGAFRVASNEQLYLDLYDYPVRGREQAEHLYDRLLRPRFENAGLL